MATSQQIQALASGFSIETTPATAAKVESFKALLPPGTRVNVTFLPGTDYRETVACAARLRGEGMVPVPHIAARSIPDLSALEPYLSRLKSEASVDQVLVIGGGVSKPAGRFDSSLRLLETGLFEKYGIRRIGIAGHPEGTPDIPPAEVEKALHQKAAYAKASGAELYLVTQFCFEAQPVIRWIEWLRRIGIHLPVWIGVPGPATIKTLLRYAQECGIGPSMRVVTRQARNVAKLLTVQTPDALLADLAEFQAADPERQLRRLHLYPFGGFAKTCAWFSSVAEGRFTLTRGGTGFVLSEPSAAAAS
ncbi:MAG: methylenetetrahydrofolate reductase [Rhodospirillales bacterium]|nr:methylenetetrahydrofolate reductase [Rhodospirillales bacterium]